MDQDTGGFNKAMAALIKAGTKTPQQVLLNQAQKLVSSDFTDPDDGVKRGGLFQEARKEAPATKAEIRSLPARLGYRIKRRAGVTVKQEIRRRLKFAGYVQSTGWLNRVWKNKAKTALRLIKNPRGRVIQNLTGNNPSITLINETPGAAEFAAKTGYVDRALAGRAQDMAKHTEKKILDAARKAGFKVA